ncbi:MAG: fibronectin type III domain-containing protein, partial [Candidatus Kerfeldbacteria bacterium]|nr:fibronectin type III domain-containing protein [Candidatus Kerfeldbacteria bacterium]
MSRLLTTRRFRLAALGLATVVVGYGLVAWLPTQAQSTIPTATITNISSTNVTDTTALILWTTSDPFCSQINYGTVSGALDHQYSEQPTCTSGNHSATITGMIPGRLYYFEIVGNVFTSPGVKLVSGQQTITTLSEPPTNTNSGPGTNTNSSTPPAPVNGRPAITSVNVVSTTSTQAVISFTYTSPPANGALSYTLKYGPNPATGKSQTYPFLNGPAVATGGTVLVTLLGLNQSTTYHFIISLTDSQPTPQTTTSADRSFATQSSTGDASQLTIDNIKVDCIDTRCQVNFSTSKLARVELRWDTAARTDFAGYQYSVSEADFASIFRSLAIPGSGQPALTASTTYHYALRATSQDGSGVFTTADLSLTTSANSTDHTFSTGACAGGIQIGTCSPDHRYC